jgi:hypothetical protein
MAIRIVHTNQQLLDYSEEHLRYEFQMLRFVAEKIPSAEGFARSALIESFAVHFRNLADFFYPNKLLADDLTAADFFDSPSAWNPTAASKLLDESRVRANKEISHITYQRKGERDPTKPWQVSSLLHEIEALAQQFAATASRQKLHQSVITWLQAGATTRAELMINASSSSSNTAVCSSQGGGAASGNSGSTAAGIGPGGAFYAEVN